MHINSIPCIYMTLMVDAYTQFHSDFMGLLRHLDHFIFILTTNKVAE